MPMSGRGRGVEREPRHREDVYHHEDSERARYPDRRTLTGEPGIKPGVPQGEHHGMAAVLVACYGAEFPATKEDIINQFGDQEIEWYKGQPELLEDILDDVQQDDFMNMADLVHAIGDIVTSYSDERQQRLGRGGSRRGRRSPTEEYENGFDEEIQDISEDEWNEFQDWKQSQSRGRNTGRGRRSRGIENRGESGEGGYDPETGAPLTRRGRPDQRTLAGRSTRSRRR